MKFIEDENSLDHSNVSRKIRRLRGVGIEGVWGTISYCITISRKTNKERDLTLRRGFVTSAAS